jgi:diphthine synthase
MLFLVGIGLSEDDITLKAQEVCRRCELFVERYTSTVDEGRIKFMEKLFGRPIKQLGRSGMEEDSKTLLELAKDRDVAVLISGDPLIATTHKILCIGAKKLGIKVGIVHAASIASAAIGESGLDFYRFGKVCTIPKWRNHYTPVSFYETIRLNMQSNEHSLVLLDYDPVAESSMQMSDVAKELRAAEAKYKSGIVTDAMTIVVLNRLSQRQEFKTITKLGDLEKLNINKGPTVIIIPAKLTDIEKESLDSMYK